MWIMFFLVLFAHEMRWESIEVADNADYINIEFNNLGEEQCFVYPMAPKPYYRSTYVVAPRSTIHTCIYKCSGCCRNINPVRINNRTYSSHQFNILPSRREDQFSEAIKMSKTAYLVKECDRLTKELDLYDEKAIDEFLLGETGDCVSLMVEE